MELSNIDEDPKDCGINIILAIWVVKNEACLELWLVVAHLWTFYDSWSCKFYFLAKHFKMLNIKFLILDR